jgi:hypothetical protein
MKRFLCICSVLCGIALSYGLFWNSGAKEYAVVIIGIFFGALPCIIYTALTTK